MRTAMPHGYRASLHSGLLVPEELSRDRQVWTDDERRLLDRTTKLLNSKGVFLQMQCQDPRCQHAPITRIPAPGGSYILRCEHADRTFVKAF